MSQVLIFIDQDSNPQGETRGSPNILYSSTDEISPGAWWQGCDHSPCQGHWRHEPSLRALAGEMTIWWPLAMCIKQSYFGGCFESWTIIFLFECGGPTRKVISQVKFYNLLMVLCVAIFPQTVCSHFGFFTVVVKAGLIEGSHIHVRLFWWPLQDKSSWFFRFWRKSLCSRLRAVSVFGAICLLCGRGKRFGSFGGSQLCFVWQAQDIGHIAKTLAGVGHNTRCRQFCVRRNIWLTWTMLWKPACWSCETVFIFQVSMLRSFWRGKCKTSDALTSFFCGMRNTSCKQTWTSWIVTEL